MPTLAAGSCNVQRCSGSSCIHVMAAFICLSANTKMPPNASAQPFRQMQPIALCDLSYPTGGTINRPNCCFEVKSPCRPAVGVDSEKKFFREGLLNWKSKRLASSADLSWPMTWMPRSSELSFSVRILSTVPRGLSGWMFSAQRTRQMKSG